MPQINGHGSLIMSVCPWSTTDDITGQWALTMFLDKDEIRIVCLIIWLLLQTFINTRAVMFAAASK